MAPIDRSAPNADFVLQHTIRFDLGLARSAAVRRASHRRLPLLRCRRRSAARRRRRRRARLDVEQRRVVAAAAPADGAVGERRGDRVGRGGDLGRRVCAARAAHRPIRSRLLALRHQRALGGQKPRGDARDRRALGDARRVDNRRRRDEQLRRRSADGRVNQVKMQRRGRLLHVSIVSPWRRRRRRLAIAAQLCVRDTVDERAILRVRVFFFRLVCLLQNARRLQNVGCRFSPCAREVR